MAIVAPFFQYFHWYGFILGLSVVLGTGLLQKKAGQLGYSTAAIDRLLVWVIIGGMVGARFWHFLTDFPLYQHDLLGIFKIWNGGLSILGAVMGGSLTAAAVIRWQQSREKSTAAKIQLVEVLDLAVFGLPLAQALGRLGNYVNQELYGLPTTLPWAITIDPAHRLAGYQAWATYHPLFAYEMVALCLFGGWAWWWAARPVVSTKWLTGDVGSGRWFSVYLIYYSGLRFGLDFLRLDTTTLPGLNLGINQVVLLIIFFSAMLFLYQKRKQEHA